MTQYKDIEICLERKTENILMQEMKGKILQKLVQIRAKEKSLKMVQVWRPEKAGYYSTSQLYLYWIETKFDTELNLLTVIT